jgi:hypothetical protein
MPSAEPIATLADIKKVIQPMLSKWAAMFDLATQRARFDRGEGFQGYRPKRGYKNWVSLCSYKKLHILEIRTCKSNDENEYNIALKAYATFLEEFIELNFDQKVPVRLAYTSGTVTSGESSSTVFCGEELTEPLEPSSAIVREMEPAGADDEWF